VVTVQIDHEVALNEVTTTANSIVAPVRIDKESTGKFYFYFQNVNTDNINSFITDFKTKQAGVLTAEVFNFKPWGELYIRERISIIAGLSLISFLIYNAWIMRKSGVSRLELAELLITNLLSTMFTVIVLLGVGSVLGVFGQTMSISYWDLFLLGVGVFTIIKIYQINRMRDILFANKHTTLVASYQLMLKKYWPELVFVFAFVVLVATLPWLVLQGRLVWAAILPLVAAKLSVFNFFFVDKYLLKFLSEWEFLKSKKLNRFNTNKKW
jgi:hypothetical protein